MRKVIYRLIQLNVGTFKKCKNAHTCALRDCLGVSRPFVSDTSPKCIDQEGLESCRTGTRPIAVRALDIALGNHALRAQPTDYLLLVNNL